MIIKKTDRLIQFEIKAVFLLPFSRSFFAKVYKLSREGKNRQKRARVRVISKIKRYFREAISSVVLASPTFL